MAVEEVETTPDRLVMRVELPNLSPEQAFAHWINPELLAHWWPVEADTDPQPGGAYHAAWPKQDWHLRGRYTLVEPGRSLGFTWQWDHEPDRPLRHVAVDIEPAPDGQGSLLTVTHAVYGDSADEREDRDSHREGWQHFLGRLAELEPE